MLSAATYLANFISNHRRAWAIRATAGMAAWYSQAYHNAFNTNMATNGESNILKRLQPVLHDRVFSILDVGANVGNWSELAAKAFPTGKIYAFEIIDEFIDAIKKRASSINIQPIPHGLSDESRETVVSKRRWGARMISFPGSEAGSESRTACLKIGDEFIELNHVQNVQIIKIDVEGHEMNVINGLAKTIETHRPTFIQFEYGPYYILHKHFLREAYQFFHDHDYAVGRLFPKGVLYREYRIYDENFLHGNFVATPKDRTDVIQGLSY